jgi:2-polyprenyl-3-methyl-5-hydroxy-6-metoxy-1,4-benzoquinol methylase
LREGERSLITTISAIGEDFIYPYRLAQQKANDKVCLDTACGLGVLTDYMGQNAKSMIGIDNDIEAIVYARRYRPTFKVMDARNLEFEDESFDLVLSFEFLEHLPEHDQEIYLSEVVRVLKPSGMVLLSTPNKVHTEIYYKLHPDTGINGWHLRELYQDELVELLNRYFSSVEIIKNDPYFLCEMIK